MLTRDRSLAVTSRRWINHTRTACEEWNAFYGMEPTATGGLGVIGLLSRELASPEPGQPTVLDRLLDILLVLAIRASFRQSTTAPRWYRASADWCRCPARSHPSAAAADSRSAGPTRDSPTALRPRLYRDRLRTTVARLPEPRPQTVTQEPEPRCPASTGIAQRSPSTLAPPVAP
jgi:Cupin